MNLIYVSHVSAYEIPQNLVEALKSLEIPHESLQFGHIIGEGQFGKVYVGEAEGVHENPEKVAVAIKTLQGKNYVKWSLRNVSSL